MTDYGIKESLKERGVYKRPTDKNVDQVKYYNLLIKEGGIPQEVKDVKKIISLKDSQVKKGISDGTYTKEEKAYVYSIYNKLVKKTLTDDRANIIIKGALDKELYKITHSQELLQKKKNLMTATKI